MGDGDTDSLWYILLPSLSFVKLFWLMLSGLTVYLLLFSLDPTAGLEEIR